MGPPFKWAGKMFRGAFSFYAASIIKRKTWIQQRWKYVMSVGDDLRMNSDDQEHQHHYFYFFEALQFLIFKLGHWQLVARRIELSSFNLLGKKYWVPAGWPCWTCTQGVDAYHQVGSRPTRIFLFFYFFFVFFPMRVFFENRLLPRACKGTYEKHITICVKIIIFIWVNYYNKWFSCS